MFAEEFQALETHPQRVHHHCICNTRRILRMYRTTTLMTEKQKMLAGHHYDSRDPELLAMYHHARKLLHRYNHLDSEDLRKREEVLEQLLGRKENGVWIETPFFCDYGENITIGANTFINVNCMLLDNHRITIGSNGLIAPYVQIYTAVHPLKAADRIVKSSNGTRYLTSAKPVTIGDNVWIGGNSIICPGVTIRDNVTIGAGSVVTQDISDNSLAFGNPCEVQRKW